MRTIILSLLLASAAATPALASRPPDSDREHVRSDSGARAEAPRSDSGRSDRSERPFVERPRFEAREQSAPRTMTGDPGWARRGADDSPLHAGRDPRPAIDRAGNGERIEQVQQRLERREEAVRESNDDPNVRQQFGDGVRQPRLRDGIDRRQPLAVSDVPRPGTQPRVRTDHRRTPSVQWTGSWRRDHRYDWREHRRRHGSLFHIGVYFDPFGWNYRPYQVGSRLWPNYYSSRYWINDPGMYRLPYAPPGYRWIRYWDDALLVDTWTGEVVDSIPNFFW